MAAERPDRAGDCPCTRLVAANGRHCRGHSTKLRPSSITWAGTETTVMTEKFDLVVIGGGSGGLAAAQRAAEYGAKVVLAEVGRLGGTCVNVGCVPKKIMWNAAELGSALHDARDYGFDVEVRGFDWASMKAKRDAYIERLNGIYAANLAKRSVELVRARASFVDAHTVSAGGRLLRAEHIYIATGGRPRARDASPWSAAAISPSSLPAFLPVSAPRPRWCCAATPRSSHSTTCLARSPSA